MVLYCKTCNNMIKSPRYKYLYINNQKTDIIICIECHITYYLLKPEQFKINYPSLYKDALRKLQL